MMHWIHIWRYSRDFISVFLEFSGTFGYSIIVVKLLEFLIFALFSSRREKLLTIILEIYIYLHHYNK